ncbi:unnamed protein product [Orchesella dallaii]|uniref:EB domain-containing protein n=1 Tax=Orchesella dallaii TaxID=48710 RepID=A0ABP1Q3L5_9HEXA
MQFNSQILKTMTQTSATSVFNRSSSLWWNVHPILLLIFFQVFLANAQKPFSSSTSNGHLTKHQSTCSSENDCDSSITFLRCANKICQCPRINHFDEELNRCSIRVGGVCELGSKKQFCVAYANCESSTKGNKGTQGVCKCKPKFKETIESLCVSSAKRLQAMKGIFLSITIILTSYSYLMNLQLI